MFEVVGLGWKLIWQLGCSYVAGHGSDPRMKDSGSACSDAC